MLHLAADPPTSRSDPASPPAATDPITAPAPLRLIKEIPLTSVESRIDHMAIDTHRNRLLVAAVGNDTLEIVDLNTHQWINRITSLQQPQDVMYLEPFDTIAISNGGDGSCRFYDAESLKIRSKIKDLDDADNLALVPNAPDHALAMGYGSGGLALIDPHDATLIRTIQFKGHPEAFVFDGGGQRAYINVAEFATVEAVSLKDGKSLGHWSLSSNASNFAMAADWSNDALLIACRKPAALLVLNAADGTIRATLPCDGDCDDLIVDGSTVYASCGAGFIDVYERRQDHSYERIAQVPTSPGARTCIFDNKNRLYVAAPHRNDREARIMVFEKTAAVEKPPD
jgi:hypothetical protein